MNVKPLILFVLAALELSGPARAEAPEAGDVVIVYHHGSNYELASDGCKPTPDGRFATGVAMPQVMAELDKLDGVIVVALCSSRAGDQGGALHESARHEPCTGGGALHMKLCKRLARMRDWLAATLPDVPAERIFFAGHSAGGWASLLIAADPDRPINAVIAFAPAFAGAPGDRPPGSYLDRARTMHFDFLASRPELPALVFAFAGDDFERPDDPTGLVRLRGAPKFRIVDPSDAAHECPAAAHTCAWAPWFADLVLPVIRDYIACRVAEPSDACARP